jgi:phosphoserine phosphatase
MKSLYVISAVGRDKPGLVYSVTRVLAEAGINIVDIDARSVRGHFSMFLVVDIGPSTCSYEDMTQRLRPVHREFDLGLRTEPYEAGRRKTHKRLMVLTVMGGDRPGIVAEVSGICARHSVNIESVKMIARGEYIASEFSVDTSDLEDVSMFRRVMYEFSSHTGLDVSLRDEDIFQKPKRVVVFDCDSTIIRAEVIDELAKVAGVGDHVQQVTAKAMNGEIDFSQAVRERVALLRGLTVKQLEMLTKSIELTEGTEELISTLHFMGYKVGVISGGFTFFTDYLKKRLNLDYVYANELEIKNGVTTGDIRGEVIDARRKGEVIREIARLENISPDQIVAIGDGANDCFMLQNAGLAIAFCPKEILKEYSDGMITHDNIAGLLYFMGVPDSDQERIRKLNGKNGQEVH